MVSYPKANPTSSNVVNKQQLSLNKVGNFSEKKRYGHFTSYNWLTSDVCVEALFCQIGSQIANIVTIKDSRDHLGGGTYN